MLKQRIVTAVALLLGLLALLFSGSAPLFLLFVLLAFVVSALEWLRLCEVEGALARWACVVGLLVAMLVSLVWVPAVDGSLWRAGVAVSPPLLQFAMPVAAGFWLSAFALVITYPRWQLHADNKIIRLLIGSALLWFAWLSIVYLRGEPEGPLLLLYVISVVAASDVGAYFSGKAFGRRKLAPAASPGKSWEGFAGGCLAAVLVAIGAQQLGPFSIYPATLFVLVGLVLALASVVGDLFESVVKREARVKDSGTLLPGHGGVLDRVDGLVAALPVFVCVHLLLGW